MKTVLQIVPKLVTGGVERGAVEMAQALTRAGWKAVVASQGGPMTAEIERAGAIHITLPLASKNPWNIWDNAGHIARIIEEQRADIVHARSRAPAWSAWVACKRTGTHFVTTFHNAYGAGWWGKRVYNSVMARGERVIAISYFVGDYARRLYGVGEDRLRVIPRGVDLDRFDPLLVDAARVDGLRRDWGFRPGAPVLLLPGRLSPWKGQVLLIEALSRLGARDFQCFIVGSGRNKYRRKTEAAIAAHGLGGKVRIAPECRDMPAAYMLSDLVISASTRPEGFGRVIIEAQAMGKPVIVSDHGGARETVVDGVTGWRVAPCDADALAKALGKALDMNAEERAAMGAKARDHVRQNFTTRLMTDRTLAVYEEIL